MPLRCTKVRAVINFHYTHMFIIFWFLRISSKKPNQKPRFQFSSRFPYFKYIFRTKTAVHTSFPQTPGQSPPSPPAAAAVRESGLPGSFFQHPSTSFQSKAAAAPVQTRAQFSPVAAAAQSLAAGVLILPREKLEPGAAHASL